MNPEDIRLLHALVAEGLISQGDMESKRILVEESYRENGITRTIASIFGINEDVLRDLICRLFGYARMQLATEVANAPRELFTDEEMRASRILPVYSSGLELTIGFIDPPARSQILQIQKNVKARIIPVITTVSDFYAALKKYQGALDKLQQLKPLIELESYDIRNIHKAVLAEAGENLGDATAAQIVEELLQRAAQRGASDIHVEPLDTESMVRYRIDGVLQRIASFPKSYHSGIIAVLKSKAGMDMFERNIPQDGRISLELADRQYDVRVNSLPLVNGEKIVMRLLSKSATLIDLDNLGFTSKNLALFRYLLSAPNGIILVTGPTGSGKTTTLYAALNEVRSIGKNIVTIENPVEYRLSLVNQTQVASERGLTFATALRAILRQDPNIILVGEIRDAETGEIATEAALTGHLVLSTLHTNDSFGAIPRLINLGVESFWVSASMIGVVAQRLVRRVCQQCREEYKPQPAELASFGLLNLPQDVTLFRARGCQRCGGTGYKGRVAVHEILIMSEEMREALQGEVTTSRIRQLARINNFQDMYVDALKKALAGITTLEEVQRTTRRTV